ncbi:putative gustatory receptor 28a [Microplitis mediator]|uniref:putative gustatory receptor 28a n=1 Tax=Microplitis mediator TaxID=375433 RepID=UPI002552A76D|nr:putative gustatory receptor 28a [Microplitis mediator]
MYYIEHDSVRYKNFVVIQNFLFKTIGLSPWTVNGAQKCDKNQRVHNDQNYECNFSYFGSFYNIMIFVCVVSLTFYVKFNGGLHQKQQDSFLTSSISMNIYYLSALISSVILVIYIIKQKLIINVINRFKSVDKKLLRYAASELKSNKIISIIFMINLFMSICYEIFEIYYYPLLSAIIRDFPVIINSLVIIQFTIILDVINKRFKIINLAISKFEINNNCRSMSSSLSVTNLSVLRESVLNDVGGIKCAYMELCEICQDIGDFFGPSILIIILYTGVAMICDLYYGIVSLMVEDFDSMVSLSDGVWVIWIIFEFIVLTTSVTTVEEESGKTGNIIDSVMDQCAMDEQVGKVLFKFSHDLLHRKVELTACDIVPLNRTLLQTITGTIATYLIILVKFRISTPSN